METIKSGIVLVYIIRAIIIAPVILMAFLGLRNSKKSKAISYIIVSVVLETFLSILIYTFIRPVFSIFNVSNGVINYSIYAAKIMLISSSIIGISIVISIFFLLNKKIKTGILILVLRQVLIPVPIMFIFYNILSLKGILFAVPLSDILSTFISILFLML